MRKSGRLKLGHYPLPLEEAQRLKSMLHFSESASVLDPCIGTGTALMSLTENVDCHRYGIELDADRAQAASAAGIETVQGSVFDTHCKVEMFSLLYLNPPYDSEIGSFDNDRMEFLFLEHTYRWLKIGGVLVFVIPLHRLTHAAGILSSHFSDLRVLRLSHPESVRFHRKCMPFHHCGGKGPDLGISSKHGGKECLTAFADKAVTTKLDVGLDQIRRSFVFDRSHSLMCVLHGSCSLEIP